MFDSVPPELMEKATALFSGGEVPSSRDTVADCLLALLKAVLDEYMAGKSVLSAELSALFVALENRGDPLLEGLGRIEHKSLTLLLHQLAKAKEKHHARSPA